MSCQLDKLLSGHQIVLASSDLACAQKQQAALQLDVAYSQPGSCCTKQFQRTFSLAEQLVGQHTDSVQQYLYIIDFFSLPQCYLQLLSRSLSLEGQEGILPVQCHQNVMLL